MKTSRGHCLSVLLLALTFALGTMPGGTGAGDAVRCHQCPTGCPMHTGSRLGCHHGAGTAEHQRNAPGLRCAGCSHHPEASTAPLSAVRAILACRTESRPLIMPAVVFHSIRSFTTQFVLEPPTDPPRTSLV